MDQAGRLFQKWQGSIKHELLTEFQWLLRNQRIFNAYLESLNPFVGQIEASEIAEWMGLNYYAAMCVAIRRLDDADKRSISLRVLLANLKANLAVLTEENLARHNPTFRASGKKQDNSAKALAEVLTKEIALLDRFGVDIKVYVNKMVAHLDSAIPRTVAIPNLDTVDRAIFSYHAIFRKYAFLIAGIPCNFENPNPLDILPPSNQNHR